MIELDQLHKRFGAITAVDCISLHVARGEVLGFLGPNGAGKSTTMRMATGYLTPTAGTARLGGHDIQTAPRAAKRALGYLPEGAPSYPDMTAAGYLGFIADVRGLAGNAKRTAVGAAMARTGLEDVRDQTIDTLSKGFKRRVGLAQAILHDPDVLVLDEPTDGLDPNQKAQVRALITGMAADKAIIISTHILEEVDAICTRAAVIAAGQVLCDETPTALRARDPNHDAVALTVGCDIAETVRATLAGRQDVDTVTAITDGQQARLIARPAPHAAGATVMADVLALMRGQGWACQDLALLQGRTERVFRDLTGVPTTATDQAA
jgi:ABC-2 type transport system ATP-binding protein